MRMIKIKSKEHKNDKVNRDDKNRVIEDDKIKIIELVKTHKVNKKVCFYFSSLVIGVAGKLSFFKNKKTLLKPKSN